MARNAQKTRQEIMDAAHSLVLDHGFAGTTVDAVIKRAGVSKGAFFHHFSSKHELGRILLQRYADEDAEHLEENLEKAEELSDDPLQQLLIFVKLFEQDTKALEEPFPGCLYAANVYQSELFGDEVMEIIRNSMLNWRTRLLDKLKQTAEIYPPRRNVDIESLADTMLATFEGSFILAKSLKDITIISRQLAQYHTYLSLLFEKQPGSS